jgi:hypothetical protein
VAYGPEYGDARCILMVPKAPEPVEHAWALLRLHEALMR